MLLLSVSIIFLLALSFLTAVNSAFRRIYRGDSKRLLSTIGKAFFYRRFHLYFFPHHEYEGLFFATICAQNIARFISSAAFFAFLLIELNFLPNGPVAALQTTLYEGSWGWLIAGMVAFIFISFFVGDCLPRILGTRYPEKALRICTPIASFFLLLSFPVTYLFLRTAQSISKVFYFDLSYEPMAETQREIIEMIQRADLGTATLDAHDKQLIESVMRFKERIAREVMVPRVDVFSLPADTSIKEAAQQLEKEGYSRIPIYEDNVDNIVGVLMYKDILNKYIQYEQNGNNLQILEAPVSTIQKSVLHIPESKKLSSLLQEFRKKKLHLAIVVDEYGGTEGIVTIEDILEEIVGEISDEYDQEPQLIFPQADGTWIVDARMNILDLEEAIGIKVPEEGDYDTIGGYIFHKAGTIPSKGFIIHQDEFEMEVLSSDDRSVDMVRITPIPNESTQHSEEHKT